MAKNSGSTRNKRPQQTKANIIEGIKETNKAIMLKMHFYIEYAPDGGFVSSMVRDKEGTIEVWIPKSQIKEGKITEWIANQKKQEIENKIMSKVINGKVLNSKIFFQDKKTIQLNKIHL